MVARVPQLSKSGQGDHSGKYKKLVEVRFTVEIAKAVVFCGVGLLNDSGCKSRTQGLRLRDEGGPIVKGCDGCYDGRSNESGVTPRETRLLREMLEQWL